MAKKNKLVGFGNVAGGEEEEVQETVSTSPSSLDEFEDKPKIIKKKQVSIYLDEDVIEAFNEWGRTKEKGKKSEVVNNFLKKQFNIRQGEE